MLKNFNLISNISCKIYSYIWIWEVHAAKCQVFCLHAVFPGHKFVHVYLPKELLVQCINFFCLSIDFHFKVPEYIVLKQKYM